MSDMRTKHAPIQVGERFSRLVAVRPLDGVVRHNRGHWWLLRCDCGNDREAPAYLLREGRVTSCGCLALEQARAQGLSNRTHGATKTLEYKSWCHVKDRCTNPRAKKFPSYGGRGIKVCERWLKSFEAFFADMGQRPSPQHSIDRINNDGNYEPGNCRWATKKEQSRNQRTSVFFEHDGQRKTLGEWAEHFGVGISTASQRWRRGYSFHEVFQKHHLPKRPMRKQA